MDNLKNQGNYADREINCDLMRVMSMVFVIAIQVSRKPFENHRLLLIMMSTFLASCNSIFYMLSGKFNLKYKFSDKDDYRKYYIKKIISIIFPYVFVTCLLSMWDFYQNQELVFSIKAYIKYTYTAFMTTNVSIHLWFMYPLIGMLLSAPFLAKMLQEMKNWELNILFAIALLWNFVSIYMTADIGIKFSYSGWLLSGWIISFFAGYYCDRIVNEKNKRKFYICGVAGYIVTVLGIWLIPENYKNAKDLAVAFVLFTMALYIFIDREIKVKNYQFNRIIRFLAKQSFIVYLIHWTIVRNIVPKFIKAESSTVYFLESVIVTLFISLIVGIFLNVCLINPIQNILRRIFLKPKIKQE